MDPNSVMPTEGLLPEVPFSCLRGRNLMEISHHSPEGLVVVTGAASRPTRPGADPAPSLCWLMYLCDSVSSFVQ